MKKLSFQERERSKAKRSKAKRNKIRRKDLCSFREEKKLWKKGYKFVIGLDEVGRGCLAGPVVAGAVLVDSKFNISNFKILKKIKDSKKLNSKEREEFYKILVNCPQIKWGIGKVSEKIIDKINIKNASELAMEKAFNNLFNNFFRKNYLIENKKIKKQIFLIIDGIYFSNKNLKNYNLKLIKKGDEKVFSCAVASILAKVTRDRIMERYGKKYLKYGFEKHKGYPTKEHLRVIKKYKILSIYRKSFGPVKRILNY